MKVLKRILPLLLVLLLGGLLVVACTTSSSGSSAGGAEGAPKVTDPYEFRKSSERPVYVNIGPNGGVASGGPLGPSVGLNILQNGGNAVDAAIAAAVMSTITVPDGCGIGGHGGMIIYLAETQEVKYLDWGGFLPKAFTIDQWGTPPSEPPERSVANTVLPGTLKGWETALKTYGTISLADALAPAIKYSEEGFPMYPGLYGFMGYFETEFLLYPDVLKVFAPSGVLPKPGEYMRLPELAATYKRIAREGTDVFYKGDLAKQIVSFLNENDSRFTLEEFANFQPRWVDLLKTTYRDEYEIYVAKNQNFNPVILEMFNIWENFDLPNMNPLAADTIHILAEASKIAYNDRVYYGDPNQSHIPYDILTSKEYGRKMADLIKMNSVLPDVPGGDQTGMVKSALAMSGEERGSRYRSTTTSIGAVDKWGNVVLITQTLGAGFGSMHVVPGTGIILNNEGIYFDLKPTNGPNYPAAGKYLENQMGGAMVLKDGKFFAGAATPTGWQIPLQIAQILQKVLDYDLDMQEAIEAPRLAYGGKGILIVEPDLVPAQPELEKKGHEIVLEVSPSFGMVGVIIDPESGAKQVGGDPGGISTYSVAY